MAHEILCVACGTEIEFNGHGLGPVLIRCLHCSKVASYTRAPIVTEIKAPAVHEPKKKGTGDTIIPVK